MSLRPFSALAVFSAASCLLLAGCGPQSSLKTVAEVPRPESVLDFSTLYQQNCAGCHGDKGINGPSYPLANPEYQALVDESTLHQVVANGIQGTMMPAFAISAGGTLTDSQIDALVAGMRAAWWKPHTWAGLPLPPYRPATAGNAQAGREVYAVYCASCHGAAGKAGSITDPNFLALVSDQTLRTVTIAGRPDLGQPDWRGNLPGGASGHAAMSDQQVTDVVAWLASQRPGADAALGASTRNLQPGKPAQKNLPKTQQKARKAAQAGGGGLE